MKFFWEEQQIYLKLPSTGIKYHLLIIRYWLSLAGKSSPAYDKVLYDEVKCTGFLILPIRHRLRDYKNYIKPERGFNLKIMLEFRHNVKKNLCEKSLLKVIAVTCDGASPNSKLFRMHCHLSQDDDMNPETDVTYRTSNLYSGITNR